MTPERAQEIIGAICDRSWITMGMARSAGSLAGVSLAEMLEAKNLVQAGNREGAERQKREGGSFSLSVVPDDRLIAAAYTLEHYFPGDGPVIAKPHYGAGGNWRLIYVVNRDGLDPIKDDDE